MKAIRFETSGLAHVVEIPQPKPEADTDVVVRVTSTGVCGSDLSALHGTHLFRIPPLISGHEAGGVVEAVGGQVTHFKPGDRVVIDPQRPCGQCTRCQSGSYHLCPQKIMLGQSEWDGSFAEFVAVPDFTLIPAPDEVADEHLALAEPIAVAAHAVSRAGETTGKRCLVLGGGTIGGLITRVLSDAGSPVTVSEPREEMWELLERLGAGRVVASDAELDPAEKFDVAFIAAAVPGLITAALERLEPTGTAVQVAVFKDPAPVHVGVLQVQEQNLVGTATYRKEDFVTALSVMARHPELPEILVSLTTDLESGARLITKMAAEGPGDILKLLMVP